MLNSNITRRFSYTNIAALVAIMLALITVLSAPSIDRISMKNGDYIVFYAKTIPREYYLAIPLLIISILLSKSKILRMICLAMTIALVELLPSHMLVNPWLPDQYPYLSEPVWVYRNGHIAEIHYLNVVPGLGLTFAQIMLVTGLSDPWTISRYFFPMLTLTILLIVTYAIGRRVGDGVLQAFLSIVIFEAVNFEHINIFHRNTLFFMYYQYLILIIIMLAKNFKPSDLLLYAMFSAAATITYPGMVIVVVAITITSMIIPGLRKIVSNASTTERRTFRGLILVAAISVIIFVGWNIYASGDLYRMIGNVLDAIKETMVPTYLVEPRHTFSGASLTPEYKAVMYSRLAIGGILLLLAFAKYVLNLLKSKTSPGIVGDLYVAHLIAIVPMIFSSWGLWALSKFLRYLFYLASIIVSMNVTLSRSRKILMSFLALYVIAALLLNPITRYASIPYLHPTTEEIYATSFIHKYYIAHEAVYYTEYPPYTRVLFGYDPSWEVSGYYETLNLNNSNIVVVERFVTRDSYYEYSTPRSILINALRSQLPLTHNLIYSSGGVELFVRV
ncbi:MAG: hypothetical protein ABWK01_05890 [Infirmifilum sp.]